MDNGYHTHHKMVPPLEVMSSTVEKKINWSCLSPISTWVGQNSLAWNWQIFLNQPLAPPLTFCTLLSPQRQKVPFFCSGMVKVWQIVHPGQVKKVFSKYFIPQRSPPGRCILHERNNYLHFTFTSQIWSILKVVKIFDGNSCIWNRKTWHKDLFRSLSLHLLTICLVCF